MVASASNPSTQRQKQAKLQFKASLGYTVSSRAAKCTLGFHLKTNKWEDFDVITLTGDDVLDRTHKARETNVNQTNGTAQG